MMPVDGTPWKLQSGTLVLLGMGVEVVGVVLPGTVVVGSNEVWAMVVVRLSLMPALGESKGVARVNCMDAERRNRRESIFGIILTILFAYFECGAVVSEIYLRMGRRVEGRQRLHRL